MGTVMDPSSEEANIIRHFILGLGNGSLKDLARTYRSIYTEQEIRDNHIQRLLDPVLLESDATTKKLRLARAVHAEDFNYFERVFEVLELFFPDRYRPINEDLFLEIIANCASREKKKIPATVGLVFLGGQTRSQQLYYNMYLRFPSLYEHLLFSGPLASVDPGWWADIGEKNDFQETGIMVCLRGVDGAMPGKKAFEQLSQLPSFKTAINAQDASGSTAIHYCLKLSRLDVMDFLLVHDPDLSIQDNEGRTAYDLAVARGLEETLLNKLLPPGLHAAFQSSNATVVEMLEPLIGKQATLFERLPPLLSPSSDALACHCEGASCVECSHRHILRFVVSEIIPTLRNMSQQGMLLVMPPKFRTRPSPNEADGWIKGWEAEKAVFDVFEEAIGLLLNENPNFAAACFHDLRYGWKENKWESDIDLAVLITDTSTGHHVAFLVEVKGVTKQSDAFHPANPAKRTKGALALRQLSTHFECLKSCLEANLDWVKACVAFPNLPATPDQGVLLERGFKDHLIKQGKHGLPKDPILLTKEKLSKAEDVRDWLLTYCTVKPATVTVSVDTRAEFSRFATWCLLHSTGVVINQVSSRMEERSKLALLTRDQNSLYCLTELEEPLLVIGGPATGKSLIALEKLKKLEEEGLINAQHPGIYIIAEGNIGLYRWLVVQLSESKFIQVYPIQRAPNQLPDFVEGRTKINGWLLDQVYCVIDQLEDFGLDTVGKILDRHLTEARTTLKAKMLWITFNPFDESRDNIDWLLPIGHFNLLLNSLMRSDPPHQRKNGIVLLNKRLRNTTAVSSVLNKLESSFLCEKRPGLQNIIPEPISDHGSPIEVIVCPSIYDLLSGGAEAVRSWVLDRGVLAENIIFFYNDETPSESMSMLQKKVARPLMKNLLLGALDEVLVEHFAKTSQPAVPFTAPIPVDGIAKLNASTLDQVEDADWHEAQKYLYYILQDDASRNADLVNGFDEKLDQFMKTGWNWKPDGFGRYVAFQVIIGLKRRASTIWSSPEIHERIKHDFMRKLREALELKKVGSQPDISGLKSLVKKQRFLSFFGDVDSLRGCEAEVVITSFASSYHNHQMLVNMLTVVSRAQVQCSLIVVPQDLNTLKKVLGPLLALKKPALGTLSDAERAFLDRQKLDQIIFRYMFLQEKYLQILKKEPQENRGSQYSSAESVADGT